MTVKTRKRGVFLDVAMVKKRAAEKGIYDKFIFISRYESFHNIPPTATPPSAPVKAWTGKKMDRAAADKIAAFLEVPDTGCLLVRDNPDNFQQLIAKADTHNLFELLLESDTANREVDFSALYGRDLNKMRKVPEHSGWQLRLLGRSGQRFAVFLQSDEGITQILPRDHPECRSELTTAEKSLIVPVESWLYFKPMNCSPWRRLIVIRATDIPLTDKSENGLQRISEETLERFCERMLNRKGSMVKVEVEDLVLIKTEDD